MNREILDDTVDDVVARRRVRLEPEPQTPEQRQQLTDDDVGNGGEVVADLHETRKIEMRVAR
jgi:hypothetical protein